MLALDAAVNMFEAIVHVVTADLCRCCYIMCISLSTNHWVLVEVIVGPACYSVEMHQIVKVSDLSPHPFLWGRKEEREGDSEGKM